MIKIVQEYQDVLIIAQLFFSAWLQFSWKFSDM